MASSASTSKSGGIRKEKKDKKDKKAKKAKLAQVLDSQLQLDAARSTEDEKTATHAVTAATSLSDAEDDGTAKTLTVVAGVPGALVEFALPLAQEKHLKKVYKSVKKAAKSHAILRGVKEVNKALRKAPAKTPQTTTVPGIVIIAGDISPAEVIMHLPLACEDVGAPYIFVPSRAELGVAAKTKRPTSVVMLLAKGKKGKEAEKKKDEEEDDYEEAYAELVKTVTKEYQRQMKGLI